MTALSASYTIQAFAYSMWRGTTTVPATIFLAESPNGDRRSVQFLFGNQDPTPFHGEWRLAPDMDVLTLRFNGRGPGTPDHPRPMHVAYLFRTAPNEFHGHDYQGRAIKLTHSATYILKPDKTFALVATV